MNRRCGDCTLCCRLLPIPTLDKPANQRCTHQGRRGCEVYHKPGFPAECGVWSCRWLVDEETEGLRRPDRSGYVVDIMPDLVRCQSGDNEFEAVAVQVWCDPSRPDAWRDPALLRYIEVIASKRQEIALVRFGSAKAIAVIPPNLSENGQWFTVDSAIAEKTATGSRLLDKLVEQRRKIREGADEK
jgi:hypothetical protein